MKIHYNQNLKHLSRELRKNSTFGEVLLWREIKGKKLGHSFMRQKPVAGYIVDFFCAPLKLAIEIDGVSHDAKIDADIKRQKELENLGISFLRFSEGDVLKNLNGVLMEIERFIKNQRG